MLVISDCWFGAKDDCDDESEDEKEREIFEGTSGGSYTHWLPFGTRSILYKDTPTPFTGPQ